MRIAVTGATGLVGYPVARYLAGRGHRVTVVGRQGVPGLPHINWQLGEAGPDLSGQDALVHAAFWHVAGRYRGGEGEDPDRFVALNFGGTLALWEAARAAGVYVVFLSSRAVYDGYPKGSRLTEALPPRPTSLYGRVKLEAEAALGDGGLCLRVTGVFGPPVPNRRHKWADLFERFRREEAVEPAIGSEIHATDVARAVEIGLEQSPRGMALNASGFVLDRRTLLEEFQRVTGAYGRLPPSSGPGAVCVMSTERLARLGWSPSGPETLREVIEALIGLGPAGGQTG